ncbi:MAG: putative nucleic acid-binding protein, contains PIN domain [Chloroflexi bacterium]|jgi:predicted nucleic acid-binding protein|nr:MAG: putative nucleic acid-binding protein, contains PIN domain [Chloroflexota bacterium]
MGKDIFRGFSDLMRGRTTAIHAEDVEHASSLADNHPNLGGRDLLHAAVMKRLGLHRIVSADAGFDRFPDMERLDPAKVEDWHSLPH